MLGGTTSHAHAPAVHPRGQLLPPTLAVAPPAPPCTPHTLRYGLVPFERARDRPRPSLTPRNPHPTLTHPIPTPRPASFSIPLHTTLTVHQPMLYTRERGEVGCGEVGWWACSGRVEGPPRGSGPLEARSMHTGGRMARLKKACVLCDGIRRSLRRLVTRVLRWEAPKTGGRKGGM